MRKDCPERPELGLYGVRDEDVLEQHASGRFDAVTETSATDDIEFSAKLSPPDYWSSKTVSTTSTLLPIAINYEDVGTVFVTSFDEWFEGTAVEPSEKEGSTLSDDHRRTALYRELMAQK